MQPYYKYTNAKTNLKENGHLCYLSYTKKKPIFICFWTEELYLKSKQLEDT